MTEQVEFDVIANDRASGKIDRIASAFHKFGTISGNIGNQSGRALGRIGGAMAGAAKLGAAGVAVMAGAAVTAVPKLMGMAGQLELMGKKADVVFGDQKGKVDAWAAANANAMGLTKREAVGLSAGLADLLIPMGFARDQAAKMSTETVGLAGALAEWTGGTKTAAEVTDILSAAFMGERDGLNALGISITQAEVDAALLAKGQDKLTGKARQQAEAQATQALIMQKSTDAQAAFARGGDSLARKMETSKAKLREMGQELLVKATPALSKMAGFIQDKGIPAIQSFGQYLSDNKYEIADFFLSIAEAVTGLVATFGPGFKTMNDIFNRFVGETLSGAAIAFGWIPGIGPKLKTASDAFSKYRESSSKAFDTAIKKSQEWNGALGKMRTQVKLKADIAQWEKQLRTAKAQVGDKNLTKERRAQLTATIRDLEAKIRTAKGQLGQRDLVKTRTAKLEADKRALDRKIAQAKQELKSKDITRERTAKLNADIRALQRKRAQAQREIDSLRGKTVQVTIRYTSTGVNLTTPSSVGRRAEGGPVTKGQAYIVGEKRPELFVPKQDGMIIPRVPSAASLSPWGGGGGVMTFRFESDGTPLAEFFMGLMQKTMKAKGGNVALMRQLGLG